MGVRLNEFLEVTCEDEAPKPSLGKVSCHLPHQLLLLPSIADHLTLRSAHSSCSSYLWGC